jgi:hypothetical protein
MEKSQLHHIKRPARMLLMLTVLLLVFSLGFNACASTATEPIRMVVLPNPNAILLGSVDISLR